MPLPTPSAPVMVSQEAPATTVHGHPSVAETEKEPDPPENVKTAPGTDTPVMEQGNAASVTMNVVPSILIVPVLSVMVPLGLATILRMPRLFLKDSVGSSHSTLDEKRGLAHAFAPFAFMITLTFPPL